MCTFPVHCCGYDRVRSSTRLCTRPCARLCTPPYTWPCLQPCTRPYTVVSIAVYGRCTHADGPCTRPVDGHVHGRVYGNGHGPCTRLCSVHTALYTIVYTAGIRPFKGSCSTYQGHVHVYTAMDKAVDTAATAVYTGRKDSRVYGRNRGRVHGSCAWVNGPCTCERAVLGLF